MVSNGAAVFRNSGRTPHKPFEIQQEAKRTPKKLALVVVFLFLPPIVPGNNKVQVRR